jgi:hypothetical protein
MAQARPSRLQSASPQTASPGRVAEAAGHAVVIGLNAAIVTVWEETPHALVVARDAHASDEATDGLPFGPFEPLSHRTLESGLRSWVEEQTSLEMGYVEQLYTFGDRGRHEVNPGEGPRIVSVGYLALTRALSRDPPVSGTSWRSWYLYFPWEDWRTTKPALLENTIKPRLDAFVASTDQSTRERQSERIRLTFGFGGAGWDEEKVLERYELLYEAGLVDEALRDGRQAPKGGALPEGTLGQAMTFDHRRILATAMGRLRGKLKYRPVIFELMPPAFTLLELQRTVEGISGIRLHKQNFRRLVENAGLVERTGRMSARAVGRPAEQFRFRREVLRERPAPGVKLSSARRGRS